MDKHLQPPLDTSTAPVEAQIANDYVDQGVTGNTQPTNELAVAIRALRIELSTANDHVAKRFGLKPRDLDVLDIIDQDEPCTPTYLARRTGIHAATLTGILVRLEVAGWIDRRTDPVDGRSASIAATPRFKQLRDAFQDGRSSIGAVWQRLTVQERTTIINFLKQATSIIRAEALVLDDGACAIDKP